MKSKEEPLPAPSELSAATQGARVAVLGAGAVGSYFGGMLARAGAQVTLIAREAHVQAIRRSGLFLDTVTFQERVTAAASTEVSAARAAEFVLFCVKTVDTEEAAGLLAPHLAPGAIVISLQNGVDNVARIRTSSGIDALPAVVYVAAALPEPGRVKHSGRGEIVAGELPSNAHATGSQPARPERVAALFTGAGVPCRVSPNIEIDMWTEAGWVEKGIKNAEGLGEATSSTAQDIARGKRTEIDSLNGYIVRRGAELGIQVPVSATLTALVKLIEERNVQKGRPAASSQ